MKHSRTRRALVLLMTGSTLALFACARNYEGSYSNDDGSLILELKSSNEATVTTKSHSQPCMHHSDKNLIVVECKDDLILLKMNSDNSITIQEASRPISDEFKMGALKKVK